MELINNGGNGKEGQPDSATPETPKKTHEEYMRDFAGKLNEILSEGYPLAPIIQVLDSALFEMKMNMYFQQIEMMERAKQAQKRIEIPHMKIPTGKMK